MRSIVYRYGDLFSFGRALGAADQELPLPEGERVADGEWVLAMFEVGERRRATAAAARGLDKGHGDVVLAFERRDWERLQAFSEAKSEKLRAAKPVAPPSDPIDSIPISVDRGSAPSSATASVDAAADANATIAAPPYESFEPPTEQRPVLPSTAPGAPSTAPGAPSAPPTASTPAHPVSGSTRAAARTSAGPGAIGAPRPPTNLGPMPPAVPRPASPKPPTRASSPGSSGKMQASPSGRFVASARVLLVDDDPDIRDVVGAMLEAVGLTVEPVGNAEDALERVRETHFDLLVLDWNLPGMTGLELCRTIRREEHLAQLPVLFLTAHSSSKDIVEAFASGADDYVSKPFRAPELGARILGLLRRARAPQTSP